LASPPVGATIYPNQGCHLEAEFAVDPARPPHAVHVARHELLHAAEQVILDDMDQLMEDERFRVLVSTTSRVKPSIWVKAIAFGGIPLSIASSLNGGF
jgi:hypothetical protein